MKHSARTRAANSEVQGKKGEEKEEDSGRETLKRLGFPDPSTQNFGGMSMRKKNSAAGSSSKPQSTHKPAEPPPSSSMATIDLDPDESDTTRRPSKRQTRSIALGDATPTRTSAGSSRVWGKATHTGNQTREAKLKKRVPVETTRRCIQSDDEDSDEEEYERPPPRSRPQTIPQPRARARREPYDHEDTAPPRSPPPSKITAGLKPRPKPRQKAKYTTDEDDNKDDDERRANSDPEGTPRASRSRTRRPKDSRTHHNGTLSEEPFGPPPPTSPSTLRRKFAPFPLGPPSPAKENEGSPPPRTTGGKAKGKALAKEKHVSSIVPAGVSD